jgi:hypothetical protein
MRKRIELPSQAGSAIDPPRVVLFVCQHGAGMSRLAAAWFNRVAPGGWIGVSAGQHPDPELSSNAAHLLAGTAAEPFLDRDPPRPVEAVSEPTRRIAIVRDGVPCDVPGAERWDLGACPMGPALRDGLRARAEVLASELARG